MLNISAAVSYGWQQFKKMPGYMIGLLAIIILISLIPSVLNMVVGKVKILAFIVSLAGIVLQLIVSLGLIKIMIAVYNGSKPGYGMLFDEANKIGKYFLASLLYALIVCAGMLLFIIPGIIWSIKYRFYPYFIVEKNAGVWESLDMSGKITNGNKWTLLGLSIVMTLLVLVSMIPFGLGVLITAPMSLLVSVYTYKVLLGAQPAAAAPTV